MPGTRFDACRWEVRKADGEGCAGVDSHRYLAGPSWRGWTLDVGLRAFDVEIRTRDGRRVGKLPRAYGGDTGTVRDPAVLLPALARKPRAWGESPIRADFPDRLRLSIDAMESRERQRYAPADSQGIGERRIRCRGPCRRTPRGTGARHRRGEPDDAGAQDRRGRDAARRARPGPARLRPVHAAVRRPEGGMMTKPGTAQPDTRRRRASTGQLMDGIMGLARRLPLTRQVLADQLETATPAQMEFMHAWMNAEIDSRERSKRARLLKQAGSPKPRTLDGYDWTPLRFPVDYGRQALESLDFVEHTEDVVMFGPSRHRQDPPGHRAGPAGLPGGRTDPVLHRRRARHATTARQRGRTGSTGSSPRSAGPGSWSSTSSDTSRSTRKAAASCSRSSPTRTKDRASSTPPTSSSAAGAGSSATPHGRRDHRPHRPPRQDDQIRGRQLPQNPRPHAITQKPPTGQAQPRQNRQHNDR